ncbi:MAG: phasin family protein [Desulfovibrio sp.]|uniref:phasin family protein n=1 Tax=Desulfovibrio sp. 7SRBS1 TaxID=3378064 RepID=UPI003B3DEB06
MKPADLLYLGLGAASMARDSIEAKLKEFQEQGELSREEIKHFADQAMAKGKEEQEAFEERIRECMRKAMSDLNMATKDDIEELKKLINKS